MINIFPYTDAHELNLDWVVEQVKANNTKVKDLTHTVENMHFEFDSKADKATTYTKTEVDTLLSGKVDNATLANYYDKSETYSDNEVDDLISNIRQLPDSSTATPGDVLTHTISGDYWYPLDAYSKAETDVLLSAKADISSLAEVATSGNYVDLDNKPSGGDFVQSLNDTVSLTGVSGGWVTYQVTFATPFKVGTTPLVSIYRSGSVTNTSWTLPMIKNLTNTGFEFGWYNASGTHEFIWMAIGIKS